jgi:hypothetical protein
VFKNKSRGYQRLRVWQDSIEFYRHSVHRNIAEGYCRRSIRAYLNFLNIALVRSEKVFPDCTPTEKLTNCRKTILQV